MPAPGKRISLALYWSPKPWRATTTGLSQCVTSRGTFLQTIGSRKIVPLRMFRMVPLGDGYIRFRLNSFTRASSGVMVGALHRHAVFLGRLGGVERHLVVGGVAVLDAEVEVLEVDVEVRQDQLLADLLPDDAGHLVAVHLDDGVLHLDLGHDCSGKASGRG